MYLKSNTTYMHTDTQTHRNTDTQTHRHTDTHTHTHTHTHRHTDTQTQTYIHKYMHYIYTYIHTYIHSYMHTYIHSYIHSLMVIKAEATRLKTCLLFCILGSQGSPSFKKSGETTGPCSWAFSATSSNRNIAVYASSCARSSTSAGTKIKDVRREAYSTHTRGALAQTEETI